MVAHQMASGQVISGQPPLTWKFNQLENSFGLKFVVDLLRNRNIAAPAIFNAGPGNDAA